MKKIFISFTIFLISTSLTATVNASETTANTATPAESTTYKALSWNEVLQKKYGASAEQIKTLEDNKLSNSQKTMFLHIMKTSNKSFNEVLTASDNGKKDFGKLSKELGVPSQQLGQSVKDVTKEYTAELQKERKEKQQAHKAKREAEQKANAEKRAALKKEREEKSAALKKEREERAAALKKEKEEKRKEQQAQREARKAEKEKQAAERKAQRAQNAKKPEAAAPKN